jgi:hypothetical protein
MVATQPAIIEIEGVGPIVLTKLYGTGFLADLLGYSVANIAHLIRSGEIEARKKSRRPTDGKTKAGQSNYRILGSEILRVWVDYGGQSPAMKQRAETASQAMQRLEQQKKQRQQESRKQNQNQQQRKEPAS